MSDEQYEHRAIGDYGLISDCRSAALVSRDGSIDWLCAPRFDSPAFFARLLDADAGYWQLTARGVVEMTRRYVGSTMVLETTLRTSDGTLRITDAMALGAHERGHNLAAKSPGVVLREARCLDGNVVVAMRFAPRPEYGLVKPRIVRTKQTIVARGGSDVLCLSLAPHLIVRIDEAAASTEFTLRAGEQAAFSLEHSAAESALPKPWSQRSVSGRLRDTIKAWQTWSGIHQSYTGPWSEAVHHSGRVLQALTYAPTGAIVAAPTTSLPETVGGSRNWDYRYTWLRDANLTMQALWVAACPDEAQRFFAWIAHATATNVAEGRIGIMFGIGGEHDLTEREVPHLRGYRNSAPVRIGNGAWTQDQLDVYGHVLDAARRFKNHLSAMSEPTKQFLITCADAAAARWSEADSGIWEIRGELRHYLYSKLLCWTALDAALDLGRQLGASATAIDRWQHARDEVRTAILTHGFDAELGAFVQAFNTTELDASALVIPIVGFLPGDDPRVRSTIDLIERELTDARGLVYRYRADDGLKGGEGTFLLCTFWLSHALALAGQSERARTVFERGLACANDLGLLGEEVDAATGELLGNYPQAFSHIGLINAAFAIAQATGEAGSAGYEAEESAPPRN